MKTISPFSIDPIALSFREMKRLVDHTDGRNTPSVDTLCDSEISHVVFVQEIGRFAIALFDSGFYLCKCANHVTVCSVDCCQQVYFTNPCGEMRVLHYHEFVDGPCLVPLVLHGCRKMRCENDWRDEITEFAALMEYEFQRLR